MATLQGLNRSDLVYTLPSATNLTILPSQADYTFLVSTVSTGQTYTLPANSTSIGCKFKFVLNNATAGGNVVISSGAASAAIYGYLIGNATRVACAGVSALNIISGTALVGDCLVIENVGGKWIVQGFGQATGSFTTTA